MEIRIGARQMLRVLHVLSWIIFIALCVEAGAIIVSAVLTFVISPDTTRHLWREIDLSGVYDYDHGYFVVMNIFVIIVTVLKATLFYLIIKLLLDKKLNLIQPFNGEVGKFITNMACLALGIGLFSWWGAKTALWLLKKGVEVPDVISLRVGGADVWLFMGITLLVISQIFKRGIEIQEENDLTV